jgi:hypothetical protein
MPAVLPWSRLLVAQVVQPWHASKTEHDVFMNGSFRLFERKVELARGG